MRLILAAVVLAGAWLLTVQHDPRYFPPEDRVSVRVMSDVPPVDVAPGVHVRTIVGAVGAMSVGDLEPGKAVPLHHHTREQADLGVTGTIAMTIGTHVEQLGHADGVIVPADVAHSLANTGTTLMTAVEFHTVQRPDLVPPRPSLTFPASAEPVAVPDGRSLVVKLDQATTTSADRTLGGETCTMSWRRLSGGAPPIEIQATPSELFVYLIHGSAELEASGAKQRVSSGAAIVIPAHHQVRLGAVSSEVTLVEFSPRR